LIGEGRRLVAVAHQNHNPLWTPSLPSDSVKTDQGHHLEALVGRRAWCRMMMVLPIPAKGEMVEDVMMKSFVRTSLSHLSCILTSCVL